MPIPRPNRRDTLTVAAGVAATISFLRFYRRQHKEERSDDVSPRRERLRSSMKDSKLPRREANNNDRTLKTTTPRREVYFGSIPVSVLASSTKAALCDGGDAEDGYPNFTKYHRSLLRKYLTPHIYGLLKDKQTASGVTLEHVIQSGMALPHAASVPRGVGIMAGDAECYSLFAPLIDPIIREHHGFDVEPPPPLADSHRDANDDPRKPTSFPQIVQGTKKTSTTRLQKHQTDINPRGITAHNPDPAGDYILSTRLRVARCIDGFPFPPTMSRADRRRVERLTRRSVQLLAPQNTGVYTPLLSMTNADMDDLIRRHILFDNPDEWKIHAGLARDWPDGRGIFLNVSDFDDSPDVIVWCNEEDHLRVICMRKGGDIKGVFTSLSRSVRIIEYGLLEQGHRFVHDRRLGYLTSCPSNVGTALRASVHVKLLRLGKMDGFEQLIHRLHLDVRGIHGESDTTYTGIFDISNKERLGKSEVQLINVMIDGVATLIALEKTLERGESVNCHSIAIPADTSPNNNDNK